MARGRSIDKTLQPSRALAQQRDYRARKAARIESLENEVQLLRDENARLRSELREARSGGSGQRIGEAVLGIRQYLIKALDAVNTLDGELPGPRENIRETRVQGGSLLELAERTLANEDCVERGGSTGKEEVISYNPIKPTYDPGCCSGIFDCSSGPSASALTHPTNHHPHGYGPQLQPLSNKIIYPRHPSSTSDPSSQIATPPFQPDPPSTDDIGYDTACCGGVMDCSHLPQPVEEIHSEEEEQGGRGISHVRAEGRGR